MKFRSVLSALGCALLPLAAVAGEFGAATATNQVGLDLYRQLSSDKPAGNLILSPYSIESALALVFAGAEGTTRTELAHVLRFAPDEAAVQSGFRDLRTAFDQMVAKSKEAASQRREGGGNIDVIEWHAATRLFGQEGYAFRPQFLVLMHDGYAAPLDPVNFHADPEGSRDTINSWVEEQTRAKIRNLIPRGGLTTKTRLVLVNALYLKAPWQKPFEKNATHPESFFLAPDKAENVATMHRTDSLGYATEDGLTIASLDYLGGDLQFLIILPNHDQTTAAIAAKLTTSDLARWSKLVDQHRTLVSLYLPKFRVEGATVALGQSLRALGVKSAFDEPPGTANFDHMASRKPNDYLALSDVFHKTFLALDEDGTEAAAATAAVMSVTLAIRADPPKPVEVRVDRPFLFAIQDRGSATCLFLGQIADPR